MNINFDKLRLDGVRAYNSLCRELNSRIHHDSTISDSKDYGDPLTVGDIKDEMDRIRDLLVTLVCIDDPKNGINPIDIDILELDQEDHTKSSIDPINKDDIHDLERHSNIIDRSSEISFITKQNEVME